MKKKIYRRILGLILTATIIAALTGCKSANESVSSSTTVVKGVTGGSLAPYFYQDENGKLIGTDIEIIEEAFRRLPQYKLEIEIADALQGVLSGQYDVAVNNYGYTEKRAESYYFSYPYKTTFNEYIQRVDDTPLTSLSDVAARGYKIELTAGSLTASALEDWNKNHPDEQINIIYSETTFQVRYQNIVDGVTDFAIDDGPIIENLLPKFGLEGKLVANVIDPETEDFLFPHNNTYFLLTKDERGKEIRDALNVVIKEMTEDGTIAEITKKYLGVDTSVNPKYFDEPIN